MPDGASTEELSSVTPRVEIYEQARSFETLVQEWDALHARVPNASLFASRLYCELAWQASRGPHDRVLLICLRQGQQLVAIAPMRVTHLRYGGVLPIRKVEWIASWEGDRPGLLPCLEPELAWSLIASALATTYTEWDTLHLQEWTLPPLPDDPLGDVAACERELDSEGYGIHLTGTFEAYIAGRDAKVRANWRNRTRRMAELSPTVCQDTLTAPEHMAQGVQRLIHLEQSSWKADTAVGLGKDAEHRHFYLALTEALAHHGGASFHFLRQGEQDLAGMLLFHQGSVVHERHIAYAPAAATLSPGIVLRTRVIEPLFNGHHTEFDMMGMAPDVGRQRHKADWATSHYTTETVRYVRRSGRMYLPWRLNRLRGS